MGSLLVWLGRTGQTLNGSQAATLPRPLATKPSTRQHCAQEARYRWSGDRNTRKGFDCQVRVGFEDVGRCERVDASTGGCCEDGGFAKHAESWTYCRSFDHKEPGRAAGKDEWVYMCVVGGKLSALPVKSHRWLLSDRYLQDKLLQKGESMSPHPLD